MVVAERLPDVTPPPVRQVPEALESYLEDASGEPPGRAGGLVCVSDEAEAAAFLRSGVEQATRILPQAARSSLTGGAIPHGEVIVSVERLQQCEALQRSADGGRATIGSGVRLRRLQADLEQQGLYYPPVPTYQEAMVGGTVATNAGGASTFKYGVTREWVRGLRVLLFNGDRLTLERGQAMARPGESFDIRLSDGSRLEVPVPTYRLPELKKLSAGYYASDPLDLVDLFVGSEGTLGLITAVTLDLVPLPPSTITGLVFLPDAEGGLRLGIALRKAAELARDARDEHGPDVRAIEWMDDHALEILRRHDDARRRRIALPDDARSALLFEVELEETTDNARAQDLLSDLLEGREVVDCGLVRLFRIMLDHGALDHLEVAFPQDERRQRALNELREAVPQRVGELLSHHKAPGMRKVAGDIIVPFDHVPEMIAFYRRGFEARGLDFAIWGHLGDGNLHPNALPRDQQQVRQGQQALLAFAEEATRRGGCPLSEHGVGRNPIKQEMLRRFLGDGAMAEMRRIKCALDPQGRFAPGVLFPA